MKERNKEAEFQKELKEEVRERAIELAEENEKLKAIIQAADEMFKAFFLCVKELDHNDHAAKKRLAEATEKYNSLKEKSNLKE